MIDATPGLNSGQIGAYFTPTQFSRLLQYARVLPEHAYRVRQPLFDPVSGEDLPALSAILGPVRTRMRAAPPRSAKPRAGRNRSS
ncbi:hypothetical protein V2S66_33480 [Streptomyces sp. V4-01]|uniref:Uncharacterized protein n=1 Tax=Actinacidiphila polyblastidii TaxID=3110430 RepID=A0ABU7PM61_9ACTN|nr:hypothetical protein [Streptomyces sp. V4-01]